MNGTLLNSIAIIILSIGCLVNAYGDVKQDKRILENKTSIAYLEQVDSLSKTNSVCYIPKINK